MPLVTVLTSRVSLLVDSNRDDEAVGFSRWVPVRKGLWMDKGISHDGVLSAYRTSGAAAAANSRFTFAA